MERTAEEFVQQLPEGTWIVADYPREGIMPCVVRFRADGRMYEGLENVPIGDVSTNWRVRQYRHKRSAKRAAQAMLERELDNG